MLLAGRRGVPVRHRSACSPARSSSYVPVTLTSDRAGLVMETGAKVKMRGVQVGRVASDRRRATATLNSKLDIDPDQIQYIPANVEAQIRATTAFGAKYVDLVVPDRSQPGSGLPSGAVLQSRQRQHRGQHGVPEPRRRAREDRPGQAERGAVRARRRRARPGRADRAGDHRRQPGADSRSTRAARPSGRTGGRSRTSTTPTPLPRRTSLPCSTRASTTSATVVDHAAAAGCACCSTRSGCPTAGIDLLGANKDNLVGPSTSLEPTTEPAD